MKRLTLLLIAFFTFLSILSLPAVAADPVQRYVEAEDCTGLLLYPTYNEDAKGWYAMQANCRYYGAPGQGICAVIHESANNKQRTMTQKLDKPIPAGKYQVFLRVVGSGARTLDGGETIIRVTVGDASGDVTWKHKSRDIRFNWKKGAEITLTKPADTISFTAVKFGNNSLSALYEPEGKSLWIDTLYLTSDLKEKKPPALEEERGLRFGKAYADMPKRETYKRDEMREWPQPERKTAVEPIKLESFDGRKNLWPNSSFELGMNDGWAGTQPWCFTDKDLDTNNPFDGTYSLHIPEPYGKTWQVNGPDPGARRPPGIYPFSRPYYLPKGGKYCLSLYVRGKKGTKVEAELRQIPEMKVYHHGYLAAVWRNKIGKNGLPYGVALLAGAKMGDGWTRLEGSRELKPGWYYLYVKCPTAFNMDAIQLEPGEKATAYAPRAEVEVALRSGQYANIIYLDQQKTLEAWAYNSGKKSANPKISYRIVDVAERIVGEGVTPAIAVGPGKTVHMPVKILPEVRGVFSVTNRLDGRDKGVENELVYTGMPSPLPGLTRHNLGVNATLHPTDLALHKRLGCKYILTCKTPELGGPRYMRGRSDPNEWKWHDERAAQAKKFGMILHPSLWVAWLPDYMLEDVSGQYRSTRAHGTHAIMPKEKLWDEHVAKVTKHYQGIVKNWCIDDETELHYDARLLAKVVNMTIDAVKKSGTGVGLDVSCTPEFTEEIIKEGVDPNQLAFFSGSFFDFQYWTCRYVSRLKHQYNDKPVISYGVGQRLPPSTMYHTQYSYVPMRWKANWMARQLIYQCLLADINVPGHYAGLWRNNGYHVPGDKHLMDYDGSPLPWGGTFGIVGRLLANAELIDDVPLGDTGRRVLIFRDGDRIGAVTWSNLERNADHNFMTAHMVLSNLKLACPEGSVEMLDYYFNPRDDGKWIDGKLTFDLDTEPVFLMNKSMSPEAFKAMFAGATADPSAVGSTLALVPDGKGGVMAQLQLVNRTGKELKAATIDFRLPKDEPFTTTGGGILAEPFQKLGSIPADKDKTLDMAMVLDKNFPLEDACVRGVLKDAAGNEYVAQEWLWLIRAGRMDKAPAVNGDVSPWAKVPSAWLFYDWAWALPGRSLSQLGDGGENLGYPTITLQARAQLWTSWDDKNLYLAARLMKDQPMLPLEKGDTLRYVLDAGKGRYQAVIRVGAKNTVKGELTRDGGTAEALNVATKTDGNNVTVTVAIPWKTLGVAPSAGQVIRYDAIWTDSFIQKGTGKNVTGALRWAGQSSDGGFLLLENAKK